MPIARAFCHTLIRDFSGLHGRGLLLGCGKQRRRLVHQRQLGGIAQGQQHKTLRLLLLRGLWSRNGKSKRKMIIRSDDERTNVHRFLATGRAGESELQRDAGTTAPTANKEESQEVHRNWLQPAAEPVRILDTQCQFRSEGCERQIEHSAFDGVNDSTRATRSAGFRRVVRVY